MQQNQLRTNLSIQSLELNLYLGWSMKERENLQKVLIDIELHFPKPPKACVSDELTDTVDYDFIVRDILKRFEKQTYKLIEALTKAVYSAVKRDLDTKIKISVRIHKVSVPLPGLKGGTAFTISEVNGN